MKPGQVAIVGAAETTELGKIPGTSQIQLHADAALNAMADAGLSSADMESTRASWSFGAASCTMERLIAIETPAESPQVKTMSKKASCGIRVIIGKIASDPISCATSSKRPWRLIFLNRDKATDETKAPSQKVTNMSRMPSPDRP